MMNSIWGYHDNTEDGLFSTISSISPQHAMEIPEVAACVNLLSSTIAQLPLEAKKLEYRNGRMVRTSKGVPIDIAMFCEFPSASMPRERFWELMLRDLYLYGNAYALDMTDATDADHLQFLYIPYNMVYSVEKTDYRATKYRIYHTHTGITGYALYEYTSDMILNISWGGRSLFDEYGKTLRTAHVIDKAYEDIVRRGNNNFERMAVMLTGALKPEDIRDYMNSVRSQYAGNGDLPLILGGNSVSVDALRNYFLQDTQLLEKRAEISRVIAAGMFGVNPQVLGDNKGTSNWGSGVAESYRSLVRGPVAKGAGKISSALTDFMVRSGREPYRFEHDTDSLTSLGRAEMMKVAQTAMGTNNLPSLMTREEGREMVGLEPEPSTGTFTGINKKGNRE